MSIEYSPGNVSSPHILIVEKNLAIRDLLFWVVAHAGYRTTAIVGEQDMLAWVNEALSKAPPPALILLDLSLPRESGISYFQQFCICYQRYFILPPIILLTTYNCYDDLEVEQVIRKPFHIKTLILTIEQVLSCCSCNKFPSGEALSIFSYEETGF